MKMGETRRIADELNRGCSSENVWKYFFASQMPILKTSAVIATTKATITLENIPNLQLTLAEDKDEEESRSASDELDCKISDAICRSTVTPEEHISRQTDHSPHFGVDYIHTQGPDREKACPDHLVHWRQRCLQEYFSVSYGVSFHKHPSYTFALCVHSKYT